MNAKQLKENQTKLKEVYSKDPALAVQTLKAVGRIHPESLSCELIHPAFWTPAGLHPSSGGDGSFACSVEIMLAGLLSCAAVTMAAVANAMKIEIQNGVVTAEGTMDFRGTLGVDRDAPVGLTGVRLVFDVQSDADPEKLDKMIQLTERYCVVHQTLLAPPELSLEVNQTPIAD